MKNENQEICKTDFVLKGKSYCKLCQGRSATDEKYFLIDWGTYTPFKKICNVPEANLTNTFNTRVL